MASQIVRGYARGGLSKIADLLKETAEQTAKRQAKEAKAAKVGTPGFFSTLDEMIRNSPKAKMSAQEWRDYLKPGAPHVRGDVTFRLKPEELEHSGVGNYLLSLGNDQLPLPIPRADLRSVARSARDKISFTDTDKAHGISAMRPTEEALGSAMEVWPTVSVSGLPKGKTRYEPSVRHEHYDLERVKNPISYSAHVASPLGGDLITHIGSAAHEPAFDKIASPKKEIMDELRSSLENTPLADRLDDLAAELGLKKSILSGDAELHPSLEATTRGYGPTYKRAYADWAHDRGITDPDESFFSNRYVFENDTGRVRGGEYEPANINVPFKGLSGYAGLELRKRLLGAANADRSFLGLARSEDLPARGSARFANSSLDDPYGIPKQLRKLASQYGLTVDPNHSVAMPDKGESPRTRPWPDKYAGLMAQRINELTGGDNSTAAHLRAAEHIQDNPVSFDDYYNYAKTHLEERTATNPEDVRSFTRDFKRNVLLGAKANKDHLTELLENGKIPDDLNHEAHAALNVHDPVLKKLTEDYSANPYYDPDPVAYADLRTKAGNIDFVLGEHYKRKRQIPEPVQEPYRRMAAILSPEDRERIKKIGVPLWAVAATTLGQQALGPVPDAPVEDSQGFARGGVVRGYARGGLRKLTDLLKETSEETAARRAVEMAKAKTTIPGAFSTLNELIESAPMDRATPIDWSNYLAPGKALMRGDVSFPLKKEELSFTGISDYLKNAAERLKAGTQGEPTHMSREELAAWLQAHRPGLGYDPRAGNNTQYSSYASRWPHEGSRDATYREDVLTLDDPELAQAAREVTPHFRSTPGAFMWTRGYDLPEGGFLNELQHDPAGKASDRFAVYDTSNYDKLRALIGRTPMATERGTDEAIARIEDRYIPNRPKELSAGERPSSGSGAIVRRRNDTPGIQHVDERIPFMDLQKGHAPLGIRQMLVRLADANKRFLAIGNRDDAGYAAGAGGYGGLGSGRKKAMTSVYEHSFDPAEGADESRSKGMIFTPVEQIQKQYGIGFDPNHLISGGDAKAGVPLPSAYEQTGDVRFDTHIRHLLEDHPPDLNPETEHAWTATTVHDAAQKALDHYKSVDWPDEQSYEAATHLKQAEDVMTEVRKHLHERPNTPLDNDYYITLVSDIKSLDRLSDATGSLGKPAIHRPALTMTPEQAQKVSKIGFPLWALGAGALAGKSQLGDPTGGLSEDDSPGYARGGMVEITKALAAMRKKLKDQPAPVWGAAAPAQTKPITMSGLADQFNRAITEHMQLPPEERIRNSIEAEKRVAQYTGRLSNGSAKDLLQKNAKMMKSETGIEGKVPITLPDGRGVETTGLSLAPAYEEKGFVACPNSAPCKTSCLGKTSGGNFMFGGGSDLEAMKGPRLAHFRNTQAMLRDPAAFAIKLNDEITAAKQLAEANGNKLGVRLNLLSDIHPKVHEALINAHPDVDFYDYTKNASNPIAPNHHYTYSSTGVDQSSIGVLNPHQNWSRMRNRLSNGQNVAMAFSVKGKAGDNKLPAFVHDSETGAKFAVIDGDTHDYRQLDAQPPGAPGVIVGLRNKAGTTKGADAAVKSNGFFVHHDPKVSDTVVIEPQKRARAALTNDLKVDASDQ